MSKFEIIDRPRVGRMDDIIGDKYPKYTLSKLSTNERSDLLSEVCELLKVEKDTTFIEILNNYKLILEQGNDPQESLVEATAGMLFDYDVSILPQVNKEFLDFLKESAKSDPEIGEMLDEESKL